MFKNTTLFITLLFAYQTALSMDLLTFLKLANDTAIQQLEQANNEYEQLIIQNQKPNETLVSISRGYSISLPPTDNHQKTISTYRPFKNYLATGIYVLYKNKEQAAGITLYSYNFLEDNIAKLKELINNLCLNKEIEKIHTIFSAQGKKRDLTTPKRKNNIQDLTSILDHLLLEKYRVQPIKHTAFYYPENMHLETADKRDLEIILSPDGQSYFSMKNPNRTVFFE